MIPAVGTLLTPLLGSHICSFLLLFASEESTPGGSEEERGSPSLLPSLLDLTPPVGSSLCPPNCNGGTEMSIVTPQPGSYICSFFVISTSETSTTGLTATVAASLEAPWRRFFCLMVAP